MGIYDRHYLRSDGPAKQAAGRRIGSVLSTWSITTWIIVLCVGVFALDGFLPRQWVPMTHQLVPNHPPIDSGALAEGPREVLEIDPWGQPLRARAPLYFRSGGMLVQVGTQEYQRMRFLEAYLHFSTSRGIVTRAPDGRWVGFEFWRLIGFQFLHANLPHLAFNMLGLFFFGPMVEEYLGRKRYLAFYLLCGIFGALAYLLLNLGGYIASMQWPGVAVPGLVFNAPGTPLVGASAGVFGVLMAGAFLAPNAVVLFMFIVPMRLATLAYLLVAVAMATVLFHGQNAGGEAGHLGGALAGWYFIRRPRHLHGFFDFLGWVDPTSHHYRERGRPRRRAGVTRPSREEIDRILDKISVKGVHSLTTAEKHLLEEASRDG
jgi:membrane associated rhomboid family serine protease